MNYQINDAQYQQFLNEMKSMEPVAGNGLGIEFFKFEKDVSRTYVFRPLVSKIPNKLSCMVKNSTHYGFYNPNTGRNGAFPCLTDFGLACPLCYRVQQMKGSVDVQVQTKASELEPVEGFFMYVKDMNTNKIGVLQFSGKRAYTAFANKFNELFLEGFRDPGNPSQGVVLQINKSGSKATVNFSVAVIHKNHSLSPEEINYFNQLPPLTEIRGSYSIQDYEKILRGEKFGQEAQVSSIPQTIQQQTVQQPVQPFYNYGAPASQPNQQPITGAPVFQYSQPIGTGNPTPQFNQQPNTGFPPVQQNPAPMSFPNPAGGNQAPTVEELQRMLNSGK